MAYDCIPSWFHQLYKAVLSNGYHPKCWREAKGAILAKPNKPDYQSPKAYRIIALLNCLGKIAEKLVAKRLSSLCEQHQLLYQDQMGGRPHRSATDAILALVHDIQQGNNQRMVTSALFMDVKGAFDNVSRQRLLHTMTEMGLPTQLVKWTDHFMTGRQIGLAFDGEEEGLHAVETGIPQGSPTSPILFIIYLQPLFTRLQQAGLQNQHSQLH